MSLRNVKPKQTAILDIKNIYWMQTPYITAFQWRFRDAHAYSKPASFAMATNSHVVANMHRRRWLAKKEPLWVYSSVYKDSGLLSKCVVRRWVVRRLKTAFQESLRKRGYNYDGTRIDESEEGMDIYGTVMFQANEITVRLKHTELIGQTDLAVEKMFEIRKCKGVDTVGPRENGSRSIKPRRG